MQLVALGESDPPTPPLLSLVHTATYSERTGTSDCEQLYWWVAPARCELRHFPVQLVALGESDPPTLPHLSLAHTTTYSECTGTSDCERLYWWVAPARC
ncbi:MAG: hypothetical protein SFV81_25390, partial [Pirellulaceae bacterium]|nr:hypothetical protein [Pirellulaceae bacterium]